MARFRLSLLAALSCQTILAGQAAAQSTAQDSLLLEPIVLEGRADPSAPISGPDPETATGSKTAVPVTETPQSISVVGRAEMDSENLTKLDAAFNYRAGVTGQPYGYDSDTNWVFVRGFNATATGAFQDGMPNFSYGFGGFYVDPVLVERVEVLKGASSALYGGANPGGLVNSVTRKPQPGNFGEAELGVDETGGVWGTLDLNRQLTPNTEALGILKLERVDGHGAFDPGLHGVASGSIRHRVEGGPELTFGIDYTRVDEKHVGDAWLPYVGTVKDAPFGRIAREFNTGEPDHDSYKRDQIVGRFGVAQDVGDWRLENNMRLGWSKVGEDSVYAYGYAGFSQTPTDDVGTMSRLVFDHRTESTTFLNDARASTTLDLGPTTHDLAIGADLKYFRMDQVQASASGTPLTFDDPAYGAAQAKAVPYLDQKLDQTQLGLYLQDQIRFGEGWIATANGRYDWVDTSSGVNRATGAAGADRKDGEFSWRLGLAKELPGGITPYVSASSYFNPQIVNDANGAKIAPETGRQFEAGVKWAPNEDLLVTLAAFDLTRENISQSVWDPDIFANVYQQIGAARSRGVEIEAQGAITENLKISAAATLMDVEVTEDVNRAIIGKVPYTIAEKSAALKLAWTPEFAPDLTFVGGVRWNGPSWADNENTLKVPSHTLVDVGLAYRFSEDLQANLAVTNLFDKEYVASCQTGYWCYYGEGRRASLTLRKAF